MKFIRLHSPLNHCTNFRFSSLQSTHSFSFIYIYIYKYIQSRESSFRTACAVQPSRHFTIIYLYLYINLYKIYIPLDQTARATTTAVHILFPKPAALTICSDVMEMRRHVCSSFTWPGEGKKKKMKKKGLKG